jgi:hypothetical protein
MPIDSNPERLTTLDANPPCPPLSKGGIGTNLSLGYRPLFYKKTRCLGGNGMWNLEITPAINATTDL